VGARPIDFTGRYVGDGVTPSTAWPLAGSSDGEEGLVGRPEVWEAAGRAVSPDSDPRMRAWPRSSALVAETTTNAAKGRLCSASISPPAIDGLG
jgi:hypothetical protein